jgi:SAM-dependent methyltransferase
MDRPPAMPSWRRRAKPEAPPGALTARKGDDELVLLLGRGHAAGAEDVARRIAERVAEAGRNAGLGGAPRLHYGIAAFASGELEAGLRHARDALYERRRALLRARSGGRIVLTREGRAAVQEPGGEAKSAAPGAFASSFTTEFDAYFRQTYARSVDQAREFVAFVAPQPGTAVVEVGAGSGRITFDGGLAERVGREGQLLVTDPSAAQLDVARQRALQLGLDWLRFVCAPVEALPVEPGTADLCLGATFLHFTDADTAIRAMARVVRPGGRVAVFAGTGTAWSDAWLEILRPARDALAAHGLGLELFTPRPALERAFREAGLTIEAAEELWEEFDYGSAETALAVWRQARLVPLLLRRLPSAAAHGVVEAVEARMREVWARARPEELVLRGSGLNIVGRR